MTVALLAGIGLASSCHSSRDVTTQPAYNSATSRTTRGSEQVDGEMYSRSTLIINYDTEVGVAALDSAVVDYGAEVIYRYHYMNGIAVRIPDDKDIDDAITFFRRVEGVIAVNRDRIMQLH